jgi:hypothetical protein
MAHASDPTYSDVQATQKLPNLASQKLLSVAEREASW